MLPFRLKPYLKEVIWGGQSLAALKGLSGTSGRIGESWEVSAMPGCESVIASGPLTGMTLAEATERFGAELLGEDAVERFGTAFPILVKFIDAARDLSIQVHPSDEVALELHDSPGKCEMWYIVDTIPGAKIIPGFSKKITLDEFDRHVAHGTIMDVLAVCDTAPGDVYYLPAGRIHAALAGNLIVEVQQASDITYRIFDYNRVDSNGKKRELHVEHARKAINLEVPERYRTEYTGEELIETPHFRVSRIMLDGTSERLIANPNFTVVTVLSGELTALAAGEAVTAGRGHTVFIPAATETSLRGDGTAIVITV